MDEMEEGKHKFLEVVQGIDGSVCCHPGYAFQ